MVELMVKQKLRKGDPVIVITGKDRGKTGEILKVFPFENRALVSGVNIITKHQKPTRTESGGIIKKEAKIRLSNISYLDPVKKIATRLSLKTLEDGKKVRVAKKSGEVVDSK
jgi:large subunit ribosomal protein L24